MSTREDLVLALADVVTKGDFTVPPYPAVALRLQRMLADDRSSLADIADVVARDAALAATVLAAANSALRGSGDAITNLRVAVNRLGARSVGAIAIAAGVSAVAVSAGVLLDVKFRVWRRSMTCALICQKLGPARQQNAEQAFLAGLLHGFGRSIAVASIEKLLQRSPTISLSAEEWLTIAEEQRAPLARALSRAWQLPTAIAEAIDDKARGVSSLNDLVIDADRMAAELIAGLAPVTPEPGDSELLEELLPQLPSSLDAFSSAPAAASRLAGPTSAAVTKPDRALVGELRRATVAVADRHAKCATVLSSLTIAPAGIEVMSSRSYQECAVVRLTIGDPTAAFEPWFTVLLSVAEGSRHRVELQLFSPPRDVRARWSALYESAENSSVHQKIAGVEAERAAAELAAASGSKG